MAEILQLSDFELLIQTSLFHNFDVGRVHSLLKDKGRVETFVPERVIYDRSNFSQAVGFLLEGRLKVCTENGVVLNILQPGSLFGVAALFSDCDAYVSVIRSIGEARVFFLDGPVLERLFQEDFELCLNYLRFLSQRIVFLNQRISGFVASTPAEALYAFLARYGAESENETFHLKVTKQEICRQLNISRTTLYRAWDQLIKEGSLQENSDTSLKILPRLLSDH